MAPTQATTAMPIRIRLQVQRNDLPTVQTLWPIPSTTLKRTIAQLLEEINGTFPLESDTWGLEHYTITIGGYECLHYHILGDVLKDEDEVVVRPLLTSEVRARKVLGRDQIAGDGRHMLDGLPWGRTKVKGIYTPKVRIPPRKRRRMDGVGTAASVDEDDELEMNDEVISRLSQPDVLPQLLQAMLGDMAEQSELDERAAQNAQDVEDVEDVEDIEDIEDDEDDASFSSQSSEGSSSESEASESEDEDQDDTSDTSSESESSESESSESESSESESSSGDDSERESWHGIEDAPDTRPSKAAARETELGSRITRSETASSKDGIDSPKTAAAESTPSGPPNAKMRKATKFVGIPNTGSENTKSRNVRRRDQKELKHLKKVGVLPAGASLADMRAWKARNGNHPTSAEASPEPAQMNKSLTAELLDDPNAETEKDTSTETFGRSPPEDETMVDYVSTAQAAVTDTASEGDFEAQRMKLLQAINSGGVQVDAPKSRPKKRGVCQVDGEDEDDAPEEMSIKAPGSAPVPAPEPNGKAKDNPGKAASAKPTKATDMVPASVTKRSRLNLDSSRRLLFGSLGVRVPKTPQEEAALQRRLADRDKQRVGPPTEAGASKPPSQVNDTPALAGVATDEPNDDSWRDKIELSAVECCEEGVVLSTPPFPFHQRWDPQQRRKKAKARTSAAYSSSRKMRKRRLHDTVAEGQYVETYDKYNTDGTGDALDYDDVEDEDDEYWEEGALLNDDYDDEDGPGSQLQNEAAKHQNVSEDHGFPPLPPDMSTLPVLTEADAKTDDFVVYQELVCSPATNWQPSTLTRTVQLKSKEDDGWKVLMALRDLRPKQYDADGQRVYSKFEMEGLSDAEDEDEEREKVVRWAELGEARLLARKEGPSEAGGDEADAASAINGGA